MVIFGAGVVTGALVLHFSLGANDLRHPRAGRLGEPGSPGGMRLEFLRRMQRDLDLTADQREHIDKILRQSQERTRRIMEPVAPQLHQELQRAKAEFREALSQEQQARFDELVKTQQRFKEQRRPGHPEPWLTNAAATNSI